jgi:Cu/Ag efflux pump CusA
LQQGDILFDRFVAFLQPLQSRTDDLILGQKSFVQIPIIGNVAQNIRSAGFSLHPLQQNLIDE